MKYFSEFRPWQTTMVFLLLYGQQDVNGTLVSPTYRSFQLSPMPVLIIPREAVGRLLAPPMSRRPATA